MASTDQSSAMKHGLAVIHANQLESLLDLVDYWLEQFPLAPLENEIFLVSNNGMAQWLKQQLALKSRSGVAAGLDFKLPSSFIWSVYRDVLGNKIPKQQVLAKAPLIWRLYRLLPTLVKQDAYSDLQRFLSVDQDQRKRFQLAEKLADLYDQYQVYRSDWLTDWAAENDRIIDGHGFAHELPKEQQWQAKLWRAILADLREADLRFASRASVHAEFLDQAEQTHAKLPSRVIVFGISTLPQQFLEVFVNLARHSQVLLLVHNPCQHYWADIIDDKSLLKAQSHRQKLKKDWTLLNPDDLHQHANPLLAAWGKQGRDYMGLLDLFDDQSQYRQWPWPDEKIDIYRDVVNSDSPSLLQQLQQGILDLQPLPKPAVCIDVTDRSLQFHIAHSRQREVEILHDQLLSWFNQEPDMQARDIIVMVPDINAYAPHIRAVFGFIDPQDLRYIPFSIADQQQRGNNPILNALEILLDLPNSRFKVSECLALLEVPALRQRFGISEANLPVLKQWIEETGIRWGLDETQRLANVDMPKGIKDNTWGFGLQRLLLGYMTGDGAMFNEISPYVGVSSLDGPCIGGLAELLQALQEYTQHLSHDYSVVDWQTQLNELLDRFFLADNSEDLQTLDRLRQSLLKWTETCAIADFVDQDALPVAIVREVWLNSLDETHLQQRFLSGKLNFCTLMPMRAIPFKRICLLGMNDGDYPRSQLVPNFDLMALPGQYRPGDRSRRQDDQYLFLEALLSARDSLYVSWIGRSIRDNSELPPSVLVSHLRDVITQGWQLANEKSVLDALTVVHPLQAFSERYIQRERDPRLFTYAQEWHDTTSSLETSNRLVVENNLAEAIDFNELYTFFRAPVGYFCQKILQINFRQDPIIDLDHEPFALNRLEIYHQRQALLDGLKANSDQQPEEFCQAYFQKLQHQGQLPLVDFGRKQFLSIEQNVIATWQSYLSLREIWKQKLDQQSVVIELAGGRLEAVFEDLHSNANGDVLNIELTAQSILEKHKLRYDRLSQFWFRHVLICAADRACDSVIVAPDASLRLPAIDSDQAKISITRIFDAWQKTSLAPLPVARKTALVWLASEVDVRFNKAKLRYEGAEQALGELDEDVYLARFFPGFQELCDAEPKGFEYWAEYLYGDMQRFLQSLKPVEAE